VRLFYIRTHASIGSLERAGNEMAEFKKGGNSGPGRPKGAKNKTTRTALEAIAQAAEDLGGAARLTEWAKEAPENEKVFWGTIYPKLLPLQVTGEGGGAVVLHLLAADAEL
jgi:hypothetical protein